MPGWVPRKLLSDIQQAIAATDGSTDVFYITGVGGEGKTVLLRQVGKDLGSTDGVQPHFPWSGLLDLYHSEVNTNSGLEGRLSQVLGPAGEFQPYRDRRDDYAAHRQAGIAEQELEEERLELAALFAGCMNAVTAAHRVVVALDTTERIQYELDDVQKEYRLPDESTTVRPWLLDQLSRWRNSVVLLVGRPEDEPYLERALREGLQGKSLLRYRPCTLAGFDEAEAEKYFELQEESFDALRHIDVGFRRRLWEVTEGRPIRLDLALEAIQRGMGFDEFQRRIEALPPEQARDEIDRLLIDAVMKDDRDPSIRLVLSYLAVARRGLNAELLRHLTAWDLDTCSQRLAAVAGRSFVKTRPQDARLFLHDEMYLLCDRYLLQPDQVQKWSAQIVAWYDPWIDACGTAREAARKLQDLQVDSLFYRLRADPETGYHWFTRLSDSAIRGIEVGFDLRLRSEVLAFERSKSSIDQELLRRAGSLRQVIDFDCAVRWTKRYIMQGRRDKAVELAGRFVEAGPYAPDDPRYMAQAELKVLLAEALTHVGSTAEAVERLKGVIRELEGGQRPDLLAQVERHSFSGWRRNLALGRAHNDLGYAYRTFQGHYGLALREFRAALPYFRASDLLEEAANTSDNMGRVYALLSEQSRAEALVDDALELRRRLGRLYRVALSQNSRAILYLTFDEPHRARLVAQEALEICEALEAQRGIVLVCITLGRALRQLGSLGLYGPAESNRLLDEALATLQRAQQVYEANHLEETARLIEIHNELGCTCRARAALARSADPDSAAARGLFRDTVRHLTASIRLAEEKEAWTQYLDSCEDLARAYFQHEEFDAAEVWLSRAEERVPPEYRIEQGRGLPQVAVEERVEEYWQQMGKVELLRGHMVYERGRQGDKVPREVLEAAIQHYFFAVAYFERYSEHAKGLKVTYRQLHSRFKSCSIEDLRYIQATVLPGLSRTYGLDPQVIGKFFEDTLGLALEM